MKDFLHEFENLWHVISDLGTPIMCMDVSMSLIDDSNYLGCDMSGGQRVYELFFTGSSVSFPGIWIPVRQGPYKAG